MKAKVIHEKFNRITKFKYWLITFNNALQVCTELEAEKDDDSDPVKKQRFTKILALMQEMQNCGQPPEDLVGEQTSLFQFDNDGNPMMGQALPPGVDPQNCSLM